MQLELSTDAGVAQDAETLTVTHDDGTVETMRLHEYDRVYAIPGLYELVVQDRLECHSPRVLVDALTDAVTAAGGDVAQLRMLDIGAGNGVVGEELRSRGATSTFIGLDPEPAAAPAAERDRPGLYADYLTDTLDSAPIADLVAAHDLNCLAGAGALGMGHVSRGEIEAAWTAFGPGAWLAVTFHEDLVGGDDELSAFVASLQDGALDTDVVHLERFRHRLRMSGEPIHYYVMVARRRP